MKTPTHTQIRDLALAQARLTGRTKFTRVSKSFTDRVQRRFNMSLDNIIRDEVQRHPSLGVTLK